MSIIDHTLNKYVVFHTYLDLLPLFLLYFVLENNTSLAVNDTGAREVYYYHRVDL